MITSLSFDGLWNRVSFIILHLLTKYEYNYEY